MNPSRSQVVTINCRMDSFQFEENKDDSKRRKKDHGERDRSRERSRAKDKDRENERDRRRRDDVSKKELDKVGVSLLTFHQTSLDRFIDKIPLRRRKRKN